MHAYGAHQTWRDAFVVFAHVRQTWLWYSLTFAKTWGDTAVVPAQGFGRQWLQRQLQQLQAAATAGRAQTQQAAARPEAAAARRAVSWQRRRDADQCGRPRPRPLAGAEKRRRVWRLAAHVRRCSTAVAAVAVAAVAERWAVCRCAVRTERVRHALGSPARAVAPARTTGRGRSPRRRARTPAGPARCSVRASGQPTRSGHLGIAATLRSERERRGAARRGCECHPLAKQAAAGGAGGGRWLTWSGVGRGSESGQGCRHLPHHAAAAAGLAAPKR